MRATASEKLNNGRIRDGYYASTDADGVRGAFSLLGPMSRVLIILSSGVDLEHAWEHVSVSTRKHIPTWTEMCFVKDLFWDEEEAVVQFHPPKSDYVNCHPNCLHLWRSIAQPFPMPPRTLL